MNKSYKILFGALFLVVSFSSCQKWLDVKPSDRVTEENTFSSIQGFKQALNAIYIELNNNALYGRALSCDFIDVLAQYYKINSESGNNFTLSTYDYQASSGNLKKIDNIWSTSYKLIANTNLLIENCEKNRQVLSVDYYELIKGEALALRAMLHFDLFRLFGPVYTKGDGAPSIPYYTEFTLDVKPRLAANTFLEKTIADLTESLELLKNDPITTLGPAGDASDSFKKFRTLRLNYYAVKALLARTYLYAKENDLAFNTAKEVMEVQEKWFPWVQADRFNTDKVFSTELLFALQNPNRNALYTSLFNARNLSPVSVLAPKEDIVMIIFDDQKHDYRYMANLQNSILIGADNYKIFNKYEGVDSLENQLIPMIRMSEMFYIAAETEPDNKKGLQYLDVVRNHRGITGDRFDIYYFPDELLVSEYTREFWGEGQLFYFFKRLNKQRIQSPSERYGSIDMKKANYVLPIPESETKYN